MTRRFKTISYERMGPHHARICMDRPDQLNAVSLEMYDEMHVAVVEAEADEAIDLVYFTGAGRVFSAGGDLKEVLAGFAPGQSPRRMAYDFALRGKMLFGFLEEMETVTACLVQGTAQAAGMILVMFADFVYAAPTASFRIPEGLVGLVEPYTGLRLPYLVGMRRAKDMLLRGQALSAQDAQQAGLINAVVPEEGLEGAVEALVDDIRRCSPGARRQYKRMLSSLLPPTPMHAHVEQLMSAESYEGTLAFSERRKPQWSGDMHPKSQEG